MSFSQNVIHDRYTRFHTLIYMYYILLIVFIALQPWLNSLQSTSVCGLATIQVNPDLLIMCVIRTLAIQIQPGFNPGSSATVDNPKATYMQGNLVLLQTENGAASPSKDYVGNLVVEVTDKSDIHM